MPRLIRPIFFFIILPYCLVNIPANALGEMVIIANKSIHENSLPQEEIKNIFLGKRKKWQDNTPIIIALNGNEHLHKELLRNYAKRTPSQFKAVWRRLLYTGEGGIPQTFESDMAIIDFVASKTGAVSYIDATHLNDKVKLIHPE